MLSKVKTIPESKAIQLEEDSLHWNKDIFDCKAVYVVDDLYDKTYRTKVYEEIYTETMNEPASSADRVDVILNGRRLAFCKSQLVLNIIIWNPIFESGFPCKDEYIVPKKHKPSTLEDICYLMDDDLIYRGNVDVYEMAEWYTVAMGKTMMSRLVHDYGPIRGNTFSMYEFAKFVKRNPKALEYCGVKYNQTQLSKGEVEEDIKHKWNLLKALFILDRNSIGQWLNIGGCISDGQGAQTFTNIGMVSYMNFEIEDIVIDTTYMRGLKKPYQFILESFKGRKAILNTDKRLPNSGAFDKILMFESIRDLDLDCDECDTQNFLDIKIDSITELARLRWRYLSDGTLIDIIDPKWVGKTIQLRSPMTCNNERGVCKKCYGLQSKITKGLHAGKLGGKAISARTSQKILSGKHYSTTDSIKPDLSGFVAYNKIISHSDDNVMYNPLYKCTKLGFIDYEVDGIEDIDSSDNAGGSESFVIAKPSEISFIDRDGETHVIELKSQGAIFEYSDQLRAFIVDNYAASERVDGTVWFDISTMKKGFVLLDISQMNSEITKQFDQLLQDIDNNRKILKSVSDYQGLYKLLSNFLYDTKIFFPAVHFEMVLSNLIRKRSNISARVDFSVPVTNEDYVMLGASASVSKSENAASMLMYRALKAVLRTAGAFLKYKPGYNDKYLTHKNDTTSIGYLYGGNKNKSKK